MEMARPWEVPIAELARSQRVRDPEGRVQVATCGRVDPERRRKVDRRDRRGQPEDPSPTVPISWDEQDRIFQRLPMWSWLRRVPCTRPPLRACAYSLS